VSYIVLERNIYLIIYIEKTPLTNLNQIQFYYCKLVGSERLYFCVTTDVYFVRYIWHQIAWRCFLHSFSKAFPRRGKIDCLTIHKGDRETDWLSLSLWYYEWLDFLFRIAARSFIVTKKIWMTTIFVELWFFKYHIVQILCSA